MSSWIYLTLAIVLEVMGTTAMKLSEGLTRLLPTVCLFLFYGLSFIGLALALKKLNVSVAYAIWSGLGTALIAIIGFVYFHESVTLLKLVSLALIILGVIGLRLSSASH